MAISIFDLFTIGIGPSSSHTVGPMRATKRFVERLSRLQLRGQLVRIRVELYGSLGATGRGHATDKAVLLGLEGFAPESIDPNIIDKRCSKIAQTGELHVPEGAPIHFAVEDDLVFRPEVLLPLHSNALRCTAYGQGGTRLETRAYYSVGGGFVIDDETAEQDVLVKDVTPLPFAYTSGSELLSMARVAELRLVDLMWANEKVWRCEAEIKQQLWRIWEAMQASITRAYTQEGHLPGGLLVPRRAPGLYRKLMAQRDKRADDSLQVLDWVNLYALAVNEENAAGGRVVTAPTNGAAGIIPAVLSYYSHHTEGANDAGILEFLLVAGAIGILYKTRASISGAEVGCQGEVGVACSMAAAGLTAALGGSNDQVENAAEIGMEHNLGLTCDPIGGLVQIPCIERNAMGAVKAINAARMALDGDGTHKVSLDKVIETMRQTGADMLTKYKETSLGGLASNVIEC